MTGVSRDRIQLTWIFIAVLGFAGYYVWSATPPQYITSPVYWVAYVTWALAGSYTILVERHVPHSSGQRLTVGFPPRLYDSVLLALLLAIIITITLSWVALETSVASYAMAGILGGLMVHGSMLLLRRLTRE